MDRRLKYFLIILILCLVFWWGMKALEKNLEEFFLWKITRYQETLPGKISNIPQVFKPLRNWKIEDLEIKAKSAILVEIDSSDQKRVLLKKNAKEKLPIASLTKLMTALIVLENHDLSQTLEITKEAVLQEEELGELKAGEILSIKNLLYIMLIESSNDAAYALSEIKGVESFVDLMNHKARNIGLKNTYFGSPTGLDPKNSNESISYSTVEDLIKLTEYLLKNQPIIWQVLVLEEFELFRPDKTFHHKLNNTNELLKEIPEIIGGKTGWTQKAKECFLLVLKSSSRQTENESYLIYIILGSDNRFEEMKKLIDWSNRAYKRF